MDGPRSTCCPQREAENPSRLIGCEFPPLAVRLPPRRCPRVRARQFGQIDDRCLIVRHRPPAPSRTAAAARASPGPRGDFAGRASGGMADAPALGAGARVSDVEVRPLSCLTQRLGWGRTTAALTAARLAGWPLRGRSLRCSRSPCRGTPRQAARAADRTTAACGRCAPRSQAIRSPAPLRCSRPPCGGTAPRRTVDPTTSTLHRRR